MSKGKIRGLTAQQELNEEFLMRDTRSMMTKFVDWISIPNNMTGLLFVFGACAIVVPALSDLIFFVALCFWLWARKRQESAPLKMPIQCGFLDPNQLHPGHGRPVPAQGIFFMGNEMKTGKEVWLTNDDARQHFLVVGTTGAGKTESLLGFAANALMWGSGFLFCDGKGDVALFAKVYALARRFGREDDLLVLNFMTGNQDLGAAGGRIMSNTLNPFSTGSSDSLTQMVVSLMDDAGGDGAMWKGRATAMLTGVMRALSWLRDEGHVDLNVGEIREFMSLRRIIDLGDVNKYPDMPQPIRKTIKSYLTSLPGFQEEKGYKQAQTTLDQHGYLEMQFTKILGSLADVYGHIFFTPAGEVDMFDVVLNRRILVIMLPALEKSGDEIANLGKIVVATLKGMMGATLGATLEGSWTEVVENRVTNSPSPFIVVLDEVGYYTVEGMALMAAQARSLGFTMVYASQDIPAMKRLNEKEAASIIANTNTKVFMRSEEADVTGKLAVDSGGKGLRAQMSGYEGKAGELGVGFNDTMDARLETADRVNWLDLKAQSEGEMHIVFKEKVVRAKSFYANPEGAVDKKKLVLRANHFIKVPKPDIDELERARKLPEITAKLLSEDNIAQLRKDAQEAIEKTKTAKDDISVAARLYETMVEVGRKPVECAASTVGAIIYDYREALDAFNDTVRKAAGVGDLKLGASDGAEGDDAPSRLPAFGDPVEAGSALARRPAKGLNQDVRHRVMVESSKEDEEDETVDLAEDIGSNDSIMRALAALDFGQDATDADVERRLSDAIDPSDFLDDDDVPDPSELLTADIEDAVTDSAADLFDEIDGIELGEKPEGPKAEKIPEKAKQTPKDDEEDGGEDEALAKPTNITTQLLSQMILDDDDDD